MKFSGEILREGHSLGRLEIQSSRVGVSPSMRRFVVVCVLILGVWGFGHILRTIDMNRQGHELLIVAEARYGVRSKHSNWSVRGRTPRYWRKRRESIDLRLKIHEFFREFGPPESLAIGNSPTLKSRLVFFLQLSTLWHRLQEFFSRGPYNSDTSRLLTGFSKELEVCFQFLRQLHGPSPYQKEERCLRRVRMAMSSTLEALDSDRELNAALVLAGELEAAPAKRKPGSWSLSALEQRWRLMKPKIQRFERLAVAVDGLFLSKSFKRAWGQSFKRQYPGPTK